MKPRHYILLILALLGCEEPIELTPSNLIVVESWLTNLEETQELKLSSTNGFLLESPNPTINDAAVAVTSSSLQFSLRPTSDGVYLSGEPFSISSTRFYSLQIIHNEQIIISNPQRIPPLTTMDTTFIDSFLDNDPNIPGNQITVYYPKIIAFDSSQYANFYRWRFFKNGEIYVSPESITIQEDRFFDGNLIPNTFTNFRYNKGDTVIVELQSISKSAFDYLSLLKSQISTLGTSSGTTPSVVRGNLINEANEEDLILGFFGLVSVDRDTLIVE